MIVHCTASASSQDEEEGLSSSGLVRDLQELALDQTSVQLTVGLLFAGQTPNPLFT